MCGCSMFLPPTPSGLRLSSRPRQPVSRCCQCDPLSLASGPESSPSACLPEQLASGTIACRFGVGLRLRFPGGALMRVQESAFDQPPSNRPQTSTDDVYTVNRCLDVRDPFASSGARGVAGSGTVPCFWRRARGVHAAPSPGDIGPFAVLRLTVRRIVGTVLRVLCIVAIR